MWLCSQMTSLHSQVDIWWSKYERLPTSKTWKEYDTYRLGGDMPHKALVKLSVEQQFMAYTHLNVRIVVRLFGQCCHVARLRI